jgi:S-DNA-T family DNA segregation ATPase FtsK/SpoIIIE
MAAKKSKKGTEKSALRSFLQDERTSKASGIVLILFSFFLLVSFVSYLFTWSADFSLVQQHTLRSVFDTQNPARNHLGNLGAATAHLFFYRWYGLSSFIFVAWVFAAGTNIFFRRSVFRLPALFIRGTLFLVWMSTTLGFILYNQPFPWGGAFGRGLSESLEAVTGKIGTIAILLTTLVLYLVIFHHINLRFRKKETVASNEDPETDAATSAVPVYTSATDILPADFLDSQLEIEAEEEDELMPEMVLKTIEDNSDESDLAFFEVDAPTANSKPGIQTVADDLELEIADAIEEKIGDDNSAAQYDPTLDLPDYVYPPLELLEDHKSEGVAINTEELERNKDQIIATLNNYNIQISKIKATIGPTVTLYEIIPAAGVRISKIKNLEDDIALSLAALGIRIIAPIPGKGTIGIEVPNVNKEVVSMRSQIASEKFQQAKMDLPICLGKTISSENYIADLTRMPHLLMAGATGQGKSVGINSILISLLYKKHPSQLKFVMVDPKKVELSLFSAIEKHFLAKLPGEEDAIITDTRKVVNTLNALCIEMDTRYELLKNAQVRNIKEYNAKFMRKKLSPKEGHMYLPYIVLVIDEFADLIMTAGKEVEMPIARIAQLARAVGLHCIIATQRPSVNIITGTIKANFPARIAFKVASKVDSRTILDGSGADQLIGRGDMLLNIGSDMIRLQCPFVDTPEVDAIVRHIAQQPSYPEAFLLPEYIDEKEQKERNDFDEDRDDLFNEAARIVVQHQQGSTSLIQRRLKLGYNRAGRLMDQLEAAGIVGPNAGSKAREVLFRDMAQLEQFLNSMDH